MQFPLELSYKTTELKPQVSVTDATGNMVLTMNHAPSESGSEVLVYGNLKQSLPSYTISPNWILDFSAPFGARASVHSGARDLRS